MKLVDTHCHIHDLNYNLNREEIVEAARKAGVSTIMCVGTSLLDSVEAVRFAENFDGVYAQLGIYPHEESDNDDYGMLRNLIESSNKVVGFGDIGLDNHYDGVPRFKQIKRLENQLQIASDFDLPATFHVREAFDDFWPILNNFPKVRGTLHSFTDNLKNLEIGLEHDLYCSVNGIATFNNDDELEKAYDRIPLDRLLFETDAPFLAPKMHRGRTNQPAYVAEIAQFWARKYHLDINEVANKTTANAKNLFTLLK